MSIYEIFSQLREKRSENVTKKTRFYISENENGFSVYMKKFHGYEIIEQGRISNEKFYEILKNKKHFFKIFSGLDENLRLYIEADVF